MDLFCRKYTKILNTSSRVLDTRKHEKIYGGFCKEFEFGPNEI